MALPLYTGTLTDINQGQLASLSLEMTVRPKVSAYGPNGLISNVRVPVDLVGSAFSMSLIPSGDLTPIRGNGPGVPYIIELGRYALGDDLTRHWYGNEAWTFTAVAGGGNVGEMGNGSALAVWLGPPWPPYPYPNGFYVDTTDDNDWTVVPS